MGRRLAGLLCRLRVMLERGRETTGMVLKHMIEVEGQRIARRVCEGRGEIIPKCVAGVVARVKSRRKKSLVFTLVCLLKVAQEKVTCLYTRLSSKSRAGKSRLSLHSSVF